MDRSAQYGLNPKTVLKWRKRSITADAPMGPKTRSTTLTEAEEAIVVEFRRRTLLPLDDAQRSSRNDVLGCLRDTIPKLTRSALHRCLVRHGISRLPQDEDASPKAFVAAYNFAKHLKALQWRTPFRAICNARKTDRAAFKINPHHLTPELYIP